MAYRKNPYAFTFLDVLKDLAGPTFEFHGPAPLAHLSYADELALKQKVFKEFLRLSKVDGDSDPVIASPMAREYRTTTRRRVVFANGSIFLRMGEGKGFFAEENKNESLLEPRMHATIYSFLREKLNETMYSAVGRRCNHAIIRGNYREFCVIFNMHSLDGTIVRKIKKLAESLKELDKSIISCFMVTDPSRSRYYLDKHDTGGRMPQKKLFGPDTLRFIVDGHTYLYDPTSFAQINQSMVPIMLSKAAQLLDVENPVCRTMRLVDLYCGWGLFTLYCGRYFDEIFGMESNSDAINRARDSAKHWKELSGANRIRLTSVAVTPKGMDEVLPIAGNRPEMVILDPPRSGAGYTVISAVAERKPSRVLHIFCNVDIIPDELASWQKAGYRVEHIVPLDMFPGTQHLEVLVLLTRVHGRR